MRLSPFAILVVAVLVGAVARLLPILQSDFPLHDGGMFHVMAQELRASGYALPFTTSFNDAAIPFAYPPLGIYALAAGSTFWDPLALMRVLPFIYAVATVGGVFLLVAQLMTLRHAAAAAMLFSVTPHAFDWIIIGGGVTRGLGFVIALSAVAAGLRGVRRGRWWWIVVGGALSGLTVVTHLEAAMFMAVSTAVLAPRYAEVGRTVRMLGTMAAVGLAVSAPWWVTMISRHGLDVFTGAIGTRGTVQTGLQRLLALDVSGGAYPLIDIPLLLGIIGIAICVMARRWRLLTWFAVVLLSTAATFYVTVPLVALGAVATVNLAVRLHGDQLARVAVASAIALALFSALYAQGDIRGAFGTISTSDRAAMASIGAGSSPVAVLTGRPWWAEGPGEWFPALSARRNAALPQGTEWLGAATWQDEQARHHALQSCPTSACVVSWMEGEQADMLFVSSVSPMTAAALAEDPRLRLMGQWEASAIFRLQLGDH